MDSDRGGGRSSSSFGLFREEIMDRNGRRKTGKFRLSFGVVAVSFLVITIIFFTVQVGRSAKMDSAESAKRLVNYSPPRKTKENVSVVPEARAHPNHRYEERVDDHRHARVVVGMHGSPRVEESRPRTGNRNNIQDIIHRMEMKEKLKELEEEGLPRKPIVFKGVYVNKARTEEDREAEYFREINEMIEGDREGLHKKRGYSERASPFRPRDEAEEMLRKTPKKPIRVMLDIYPVLEPGIGDGTKAKDSVVMEPVANAGRVVTYTLVPLKRGRAARVPDKSKMILKLNLYPRGFGRIVPRALERTQDRTSKKLHGHTFRVLRQGPANVRSGGKWSDDSGGPAHTNYDTLKFGDGQSARLNAF